MRERLLVGIVAGGVLFTLAVSLTAQMDGGRTELGFEPTMATASGAGFEIIYENVVYESTWPIERWIKRNVAVRSISSENLSLDYEVTCVETGTGISPFPQPQSIYLTPGESENIWYFLDVSYRTGLDAQDMETAADYTFTTAVSVWPRGNQSATTTVMLNHLVHVVPAANLTTNSTVQGHVYDKETGQPMAGVEVTLGGANGVPSYRTTSASDGSYSLACYAYRYLISQELHKYDLAVQRQGYKAFHRVLEPAEGGSLQADIFLEKQTASANYVLVDNYQTNMTIWRGDVTPDERRFVISHAHQEMGLTEEEIKQRARIYLFDISAGKLNKLWDYPVENEAWGVDISDDSRYVAASIIRSSKEILLDENGNLLWEKSWNELPGTTDPGSGESREIRISHNNQYVAIGAGGGNLWLLDLPTGNVVWWKFLEGQIRRIEFSQDDQRIYVGSGDGFLYKLDINGNIIWRANIEAWPYTYGLDITADESLIATASKIGKIYLTDGSGNTPWYFDTRGGAAWCDISTDKSLVVTGSGGSFGTVALVENGNLLWWLGQGSASGMLTSDGKYILIGSETIMLSDTSGTTLWSYFKPSSTHFSYITSDKSKIIAGDGEGNLYLFQGGIQENAPPSENELGPSGGEVESGNARITVPENALSENVTIVIAQTSAAPPSGYSLVGQAYDIGPTGTTFTVPTTLTLRYNETDLPEGANEAQLAIWRKTNGEWENLGGTVDTTTNTVSVQVNRLSVYAILHVAGPTEVPAAIDWTLIMGLVGVTIAVVIVAVIVFKRKR